jgi:hypothetical protein
MGYALPPNFGATPGAPQQPAAPPQPQQPANSPYAATQFAAAPVFPQGGPQNQQQQPQTQYQPAPDQGQGGMAQFAGGLPQSAPGTLFGVPLSYLHDQAFLNKVLSISAIGLIVTRFLPFTIGGDMGTHFVWSGGATFSLMIWPIIAAVVYGAVSLAPADIQAKIPPVALKWGPFIIAYLSCGIAGGGWPGGVAGMMMMGSAGLAWAFPLLVFGMIVRLQDKDDMVARVFVGLGALAAIGLSLSTIGDLFHFGGIGIIGVLFKILNLLVLLGCAACILFAIPAKWLPFVNQVEPFAPIATAVLIVWPAAGSVLLGLAMGTSGFGILSTITITAHLLIMVLAFFYVLLLTAPAAFGELTKFLQKQGVNTRGAAG